MPATATPIEASRPGWAGRIAAAFDWASASHGRALAALMFLALASFVPGQTTVPAVDRDEARFAQAATQMLETGDYVDIRLHEGPRHYQPAGIYWLQVLSVKALGASVPAPIWIHRLPSLIGATLVVFLAYWAGLAAGDRRLALLAGIGMAACLLLNVEARLAKTDAFLNFTILACEAILLRLYVRPERPPPLLALGFWAAAGLGVLVKGPILPLVVGSTVVFASIAARSVAWLRGLRPLVGVPAALAIALPWYVAIWFATEGAFYTKALSYSVTEKITTGMQSHGAPPGYYLALFSITAWPLAAPFWTALPAFWRERRTAVLVFAVAWTLPVWLAYELIATKLPHYMLPLYPAIAVLAAWALASGRIDAERLWVRAFFSLAAVGPILFVAGAGGALFYLEGIVPVPVVFLGLAASLAALASLYLVRLRALLESWLVLAVLAAPLAGATLFGSVAPRLESLWMSPRLAAATVAASGCPDPKVISAGNNEASLIFAVGTDIVFGDGAEAAAFLGAGGCRAAIVEKSREGDFKTALQRLGTVPVTGPRVTGINIANGRRLDFGVYGVPGT